MSIAKENLTEHLTSDELALINEKLDSAIQAKVGSGELSFSSPGDGADPNPSTIDLSQFGLRNPEDIKIFLLSPAGETVTHEIGAELALERAIEEERQLQIQEEITMQERRRGFLFQWLLAEEAEAQKAQNELIQMQQDKVLKNDQVPLKSPPTELKSETKEAIKNYTEAIEKLQQDIKTLEQHEEKLKTERKMLTEKYSTYNEGLDKFNAPQFEAQSEKQIKKQIKALQKEADLISDKMMRPGLKDEDIYRLGNELNTVGLKIASLEDILAAKRQNKEPEKIYADINGNVKDSAGNDITKEDAAFVLSKDQKIEKDKDGNYYLLKKEQELKNMTPEEIAQAKWDFQNKKKDLTVKVFADAEGNVKDPEGNAITYGKAAFVLSKGQKIAKDKEGNYYLLKEGQDLDTMSDSDKKQAKNDFQHKKNDLKIVKDVVKDVEKEELNLNTARSTQAKAEKLMAQNQLTLMQSARAKAEQSLNPALSMQPPQSTITSGNNFGLNAISIPTPTQSKGTSPSMPSPQQILTAAAFVQTVNNGQKPITWGSLFTTVKTIQDPKSRDKMDDYVTDKAKKTLSKDEQNELDKNPETLKEKIKRMLEMAPVPPTTMNDLLKNMPKFGEDSYKNNVTSELSPVEKREEQVSTPSSPR
ncbi:hypothetical protein [Legionella bozemanae]|uniref:Coiled coil protein n=1 Tax=Legionella bozemanae TaxID=447 RepID=A0A0W0S041_LEGBO|nr:hypothetical protein [Legionella bozemanae]KTC76683.1 coiled coil protein [Legionella bozemanae]STO34452.1 Uncharacterised protein [Legionella bozemanae]